LEAFSARLRPWIILLTLYMLVSCKGRPRVVAPPPRVIPEALIQQYLAQGDADFSKMHLHGWRQAEKAYAKAYALDPRKSIQDKRLFTRFLIAAREEDEDIVSRGLGDLVPNLCREPSAARAMVMCELARAYDQGFGPTFWQSRADKPHRLDPELLAAVETPLDAYLYALYGKTFGLKLEWDSANNHEEKLKDSPLFVYLNMGPATFKKIPELEKVHPEFAELLAFVGESHFQAARYRTARAYFNKALALVPDYTHAINGLGNIYLFALEDYENALKTYESATRIDPNNIAALFGKGAALHYLGRFQQSIATLDEMLRSDLTRKGRASQSNIRYFRGEGRYFQAFDHFLLVESDKARQLIDMAKEELPDSPEINYLSALLYFNQYRLEEAKKDFLAVLKRASSNCHAHYYLGLIHADSDAEQMARFFTGACACMEVTKRNLERAMQSLPGIDLEPEERADLRTRLSKKLADFRSSGVELIEKMSSMILELQGERSWKTYLDMMNRILSDLRPAPSKE
jgi:tetratricopeptide (TPR) repeat protein